MSVPQIVAGIARRFAPRTSSAAVALALVLAAISLAACAGSPFNQAATNHSCGDRAAQASVAGSVPGLWNCLSPSYQAQLRSQGLNGDGALVKQTFALSWQFLGSNSREATYELALIPSVAQQLGAHYALLVVWFDANAKIVSLNVASSPN